MPHENSLPPKTLELLHRLSQRDDINGFTLIGGTALALRHGHRISEDLDLAWTDGNLPTKVIRRIVDELPRSGPAKNLISRLDRELAKNVGVYLAARQQDWEIDGVKVTFSNSRCETPKSLPRTNPTKSATSVMPGTRLFSN